MLIRNYESRDLDEIIQLFKTTLFEVNSSDYNLAQIEAWAKVDRNDFESKLRGTYSRVIYNHNRIVGFGNIDGKGYIDLFYIRSDFQRQGAGRQLLKDLEKSSESAKLTVNSSTTAKPFFEKMGYKEIKKNCVRLREQNFVNFSLEKILK